MGEFVTFRLNNRIFKIKFSLWIIYNQFFNESKTLSILRVFIALLRPQFMTSFPSFTSVSSAGIFC